MADPTKLSSNLVRLQKLFLDSPVDIVSTLSNVVRGSDEVNVIGRALAIFVEDKKSFEILRWCVNDNLDSSDQYQDLFRDRTLGTQILSEWCTAVSRIYMRQTLGPILKKLAPLKKALEADPRVVVGNLEDNRMKLRELAEELVNNIVQNVSLCPSELRNLLFYMSRRLTERFDKERLRVMTVFLFSRVFIPPLLNPTPFNIIKEPWTPEAGRTGILLAKVIGNLSSGIHFEEHNPLQAFNEFLNVYREKVERFMEELIAPAPEADSHPEQPAISSELAVNAFKCIHYFLYWSKDAIVAYRNQDSVKSTVSPSVARMFFDLLGIVEDIELAEGKPDPIEMSMLDFENPSSATSSGKRSPTKLIPKPTALPRPRPERASSAAPPPLNPQEKSTSTGPQMVRRISEKWNRQLQLDAVRQKQEREAAEKRAQNRSVHQSKVATHVTTTPQSNSSSTDMPTRVDSDPSLTASTDSSAEKDVKESSAKRPANPNTKAAASSSSSHSPDGKTPKRKLAPSLTAIGSPSKKGSRATVSFGSDSPVAAADDDSSSESRDSSSPSRKPKKSSGDSRPSPAPTPATTPLSPGRASSGSQPSKSAPSTSTPVKLISPRGDSSLNAPLSPRVERVPSDGNLTGEPVPPSEKNIESLSTVVRNLGVENAQLVKQNKDLTAKVDLLQLEVSRLQQQLAEAHSNDAKLRAYIIRLGQAMKSRKTTDNRVRQAQVKSIYSLYHSFDDSQFDFGKASPAERRSWVLQVVGRRESSESSQRSQPDSVSRRLSTTTSLLTSLPQLVEVNREESTEDLPSSSRSQATPRDSQTLASVAVNSTSEDPSTAATAPDVAVLPSAPRTEAPDAIDNVRKPGAVDEDSDSLSKDVVKKHKDKKPKDKSSKSRSASDKPPDKDQKSTAESSGRRSRSDSKRNASLRKAKVKAADLAENPGL